MEYKSAGERIDAVAEAGTRRRADGRDVGWDVGRRVGEFLTFATKFTNCSYALESDFSRWFLRLRSGVDAMVMLTTHVLRLANLTGWVSAFLRSSPDSVALPLRFVFARFSAELRQCCAVALWSGGTCFCSSMFSFCGVPVVPRAVHGWVRTRLGEGANQARCSFCPSHPSRPTARS